MCDSKWGVGLSSGLSGSMNSLDDDALQDMFMVAHEIGHSLGSGKNLFASSSMICSTVHTLSVSFQLDCVGS